MATLYQKPSDDRQLYIGCKDLDQGILNYPTSYWFHWTLSLNGTVVDTATSQLSAGDTETSMRFFSLTPNTQYTVACSCEYAPTGATVFTLSSSFTTVTTYYTVSTQLRYNANGGTGAPSGVTRFAQSETAHTTISVTISSTVPTKGTDVFSGWLLTLKYIYEQSESPETVVGTVYPGQTCALEAIDINEAIPYYKATAQWNTPGNAYIWDGSAWQQATPHIWNGSAWAPATANIWNGSQWKS